MYIYNYIIQFDFTAASGDVIVSLTLWVVSKEVTEVSLVTQHLKGPKVKQFSHTTFSHNSHRTSFSGHDETSVHIYHARCAYSFVSYSMDCFEKFGLLHIPNL